MTIAIKYDGDTGRITNRYYVGPKDGSGWVNTDESEWTEPNVARDELPVYYYDAKSDEITVQGERQVTEGIRVTVEDGTVTNDGTDTERITVWLVNEFMDPEKPFDDIAVLDRNDDVTVTVDGAELTKTLTNGIVSFDVTTEKSADSTIEIVAESLADHLAESDSATIEVTQ